MLDGQYLVAAPAVRVPLAVPSSTVKRDSEGVLDSRQLPAARVPWDPERWSPAAVVAVLEPWVVESRRARIKSVLKQRLSSVAVLMDAPHDPHNGAAVMRSCDAFGVQEVHVVTRHEAFQVSGSVAKGTQRWVDLVEHSSAKTAVLTLRQRGFELVATHPEGQLLPEHLQRIDRLALVLGNEHDGICAELVQAARRSVRIPMRGFVESLNVSVCAAVLLAAATRDRPGDLGAEQRQLLYARGLYRSVSRAGEILAASAPPRDADAR